MWLSQMIEFPNLGIRVENLPMSFPLFGELEVAIFGVLVGIAILLSFFMVRWQATLSVKNASQVGVDKGVYLDFYVHHMIPAILAARLFHVMFAWNTFLDDPTRILDFRDGGMEIYGAILYLMIMGVFFARRRRISYWQLLDVITVGLLVFQIIVRWGDFFHRENFGGYAGNVLAMRLSIRDVLPSTITEEMLYFAKLNGYEGQIQVHPVFLYEVLWNLGLLFGLMIRTRYKKFPGIQFLVYLIWYGVGRFWMEWVRMDNLVLWWPEIPICQLISAFAVIFGVTLLVVLKRRSERLKPLAPKREYKM